jgi:DNA-binding SARP family transcriptional activator
MREKIRLPAPSGLVRTRLSDALSQVWQHRIGVLPGPAGAGKTTALAHYASQLQAEGTPVAWYRADAEDSNPAALLRYLRATLGTALQDRGVATADTLPELIAALERIPIQGALLVIDDLHTVDGPLETLGKLLDLAPRWLRVLVGTRRDPALDLTRSRLAGEVLDIDVSTLRFLSWEAEQLFRSVYTEPLPPADLARLCRRTEGWAAGLQLFHLATRGKPLAERRHAVAALGGRTKLVRGYLTQHVLAEIPAALTELLVESAVLGLLSGSLCDRLLDRSGCASLLADAEQRALFLLPVGLPAEEETYRVHEVLRGHLQTLLVERHGEAEVRTRSLTAGQLLEEAGHSGDAVRAYCRAGAWAEVTRLLSGDSQGAEKFAGAAILDYIPRDLVEGDPWLQLAKARDRRGHGDLVGAVAAYHRAEEMLAPSGPARRYATERAVVSSWIDLRTPAPPHWSTPLRNALVRDPAAALSAAAELPGHTGALVLGFVTLLTGELESARAILGKLEADETASSETLAFARLGLGLIALLTAGPATSARTEIADGLPWLSRQLAALERTDEAAELTAIRLDCEGENDPWGAALVSLVQALGAVTDEDSAELARQSALAFRALGASVPEALATGLAADAASHSGYPDQALSRRAQALARSTRTQWSPVLESRSRARSAEAGEVRIRCIGGFAITLNGRETHLVGLPPKARQLLFVLAAAAGKPLHREVLVEALWPDLGPGSGLHNLHVAVSRVRRVLANAFGRDAVRREAEGYRLAAPEIVALDTEEFDHSLRTAETARAAGDDTVAERELRRALSLAGGELLPEAGPAEWVVEIRDRIRARASAAADELSTLLLDAGRSAEAAAVCEEGLRTDRWQDALWRRLAEALDRLGDHAARAQVQRRYQSVLTELGVSATG